MKANGPLTWDALSLNLLAAGYRALFYVELFCPSCGDWRGACENIGELNPICPGCNLPAEAAILARGLTRIEIPWQLVSPPLPRAWKTVRDRPEAAMPRGARVASRKRCDKFFARARQELAGIK